MKGRKKLDSLLYDNNKKLKKLFNYDKKEALSFTKEDREKVKDKFGVCVIFDGKKPVFVGQTSGYSATYKPINKYLFTKLGQYNAHSDAGTTKFRKGYAQSKELNLDNLKSITALEHGLTFQYIKVKDEPAFINILKILALEYAKAKGYVLYNFE
ncbi:hypothetical protein [Staphylococcus saccharolyticus]|uniref:hypothetical protein n=1 Tax=Staphylococcus saccharolyticus TaxID=33028 RepID=UPI0032DFF3BD